MKLPPNYALLGDPSRFKVRYQASSEPQEIRIAMRVAAPQDSTVAQWRLDAGFLGGAEFAPWLTDWQPDWDRSSPPWKLPSRRGECDVVYLANVTGMSHRFVPHLAARIALNTDWVFGKLGVAPVSLEIIGSLPIVDRSCSITENDVMSMLSDVTTYPQTWGDLGFAVEHVASVQNEFGVQIELVRALDAKLTDEVPVLLLEMLSWFESFVSESGKLIDFAKARRKRFPPLVKGSLVQCYSGEVLHDHRPCSALLLNMLAKFHHTRAPIARVRITSRVTATAKPSRTERENWFTWQVAGDSLSRAGENPPEEPQAVKRTDAAPTTKPESLQPTSFTGATPYTPSRASIPHPAEEFADDGLLAGSATAPALYAVLGAEVYLEPVADSDAEGLRQAVEQLRAALGAQLRFSVNVGNSVGVPRVFKYQAKHFEKIPESLGTLTGSRYGDDKLFRLILNNDHQKVVDVSFKGVAAGAVKPTESASPWTVSFRSEIGDDMPDGVLVAPARLAFSVPLSFGLAPFEALFARLIDGNLRIRWATAGYGYACWDYFRGVGDVVVLGAPRISQVSRQRSHAQEHLGFDIGLSAGSMDGLCNNLRSVNWLTVLGADLWNRLPESSRARVVERFAPQQLGHCLWIRACEAPQVGKGEAPPDYAELDAMLRPIRLSTGLIDDPWVEDAGTACDTWLRRLEPPHPTCTAPLDSDHTAR